MTWSHFCFKLYCVCVCTRVHVCNGHEEALPRCPFKKGLIAPTVSPFGTASLQSPFLVSLPAEQSWWAHPDRGGDKRPSFYLNGEPFWWAIFTAALPVGSAEAVIRPETQRFPSIPSAALIPVFPPGLLTPRIILKKYLSRQTPSENLLCRKPNQWFLYRPSGQILANTYPANILHWMGFTL